MMAKKCILFVVEGKNDKTEIEAILHLPRFAILRDQYRFYVVPANTDITTVSKKGKAKTAISALNAIVEEFRQKEHLKDEDIQEVVQVIDLDGCFIPEESIIKGDFADFEYTDNSIITSNVDGAIGRNRKKCNGIYDLLEKEKVGKTNYSIYYVSCNMDHLLFNSRYLSPSGKGIKAMEFACECDKNPDCIDDIIFKKGICAEGSYWDTWGFIQNDCESLQRHTNLNVFFSERAKNKK
nr:hypothetical protein [Clostridia bacterium]